MAAKVAEESSDIEKKYKISLLEKLYKIYRMNEEMTKSIIRNGAPFDWSSSAQTASGADHIKILLKD